jgi:hypothetical protein
MKTIVAALALVITLTSCGQTPEQDTTGNGPDPSPTGSNTVRVTGIVLEKIDQVPVDGGVTLTIRPGSGEAMTLEFESLFTHPAPTPERQALYQKLVPIQAGDRVRATATQKEGRLRLESIEKIDG